MKKIPRIILSLVLAALMTAGALIPTAAVSAETQTFCSAGSCNNALSILRGYGCEKPEKALNLYCNTDAYYSLSDVLKKCGCTDKSCENIINALRSCGYNVDIVNQNGYTAATEPPIAVEPLPVETREPQTDSPSGTEAPYAPTVPASETKESAETQSQTDNTAQRYSPNEYEKEVVRLVNEIRALYLVPELTLSEELCAVAHIKAEDMGNNGYFDHTSPTYGSPFDMMKQFGITYRTAGENIAAGYRTPQEAVDAWMNSTAHRANILNSNFSKIGVGYAQKGNNWSQMFIG